jgi:hypothetical protein
MAKLLTLNLHTEASTYVCCGFSTLWLMHLTMHEDGIKLESDSEMSKSCALQNAGHIVRPTHYTL